MQSTQFMTLESDLLVLGSVFRNRTPVPPGAPGGHRPCRLLVKLRNRWMDGWMDERLCANCQGL